VLKYPDSLVAIDFNEERKCYCQDSCDCMEILDDESVVYESVVYVLKNMTLPLDCVIPEYLDWGLISSWCRSYLDDEIGKFESPKECWKSCARKYPDSLVAIDFNEERYCYCQDSCDCMAFLDDESVIYVLKNMTLPLDCSSKYCPNISTNVSSPTLRPPSLLPTASPSTSIRGDHYVAIHQCESTFDDAIKYCTRIGREENEEAMEACGNNDCWIGLVEIGGNVYTPKLSQNWKWLNGREVVYTNCDRGEPNNSDDIDQRYGHLLKGKWQME